MGKNEELGLPFGKGMEKTLLAFDVDGTLLGSDKTLALLEAFLSQQWKNVDIGVWSGGGADYARTVMEREADWLRGRNIWHSKLEYKELRKRYAKIIAFDDIQDTRLGDVNLIVRNK